MEKVLIITQARINSSRLPKKILKKINGKTLLEIHLERIKKSKYGKNLIVATTNEKGSERIINIAKKINVSCYQGSTNDVLDRFYSALKTKRKTEFIVRLTSDCPLIDPKLIDEVVDFAIKTNYDYVSNTLEEKFPDGQDIEVIKSEALKISWEKSILKSDREHVTPFIWRNSTFFGKKIFSSKNFSFCEDLSFIRMTVDEKSDFDAIKILVENLGLKNDWKIYSDFILDNPSLFKNQKTKRNEGYSNSLKVDKLS